MNPVRTGRAILILLPYVLFLGGILAAAKVGGSPGGAFAALQALGVAGVGLVWAALRGRRGEQ
jgi:hypothetical protein